MPASALLGQTTMLHHLFQIKHKRLRVERYFCLTPVKLDSKIQTPSGGKVSVVNVCVDIDYKVDRQTIAVLRVRLSRQGVPLSGSNCMLNVASTRGGEAWHTLNVCSESKLLQAVHGDLSEIDSPLRRIMLGKWNYHTRDARAKALADAINRGAISECKKLIDEGVTGILLEFTYTKVGNDVSLRRAYVNSIAGTSIRFRELGCKQTKTFQLERMTNVRPLQY